jgi:hypothetical protein
MVGVGSGCRWLAMVFVGWPMVGRNVTESGDPESCVYKDQFSFIRNQVVFGKKALLHIRCLASCNDTDANDYCLLFLPLLKSLPGYIYIYPYSALHIFQAPI